jgi:hypothetical protein
LEDDAKVTCPNSNKTLSLKMLRVYQNLGYQYLLDTKDVQYYYPNYNLSQLNQDISQMINLPVTDLISIKNYLSPIDLNEPVNSILSIFNPFPHETIGSYMNRLWQCNCSYYVTTTDSLLKNKLKLSYLDFKINMALVVMTNTHPCQKNERKMN